MSARRDRVQRLLAAHLRDLHWRATYGEGGRVVVHHPDDGRVCARLTVDADGAIAIDEVSYLYVAGIWHAVGHVEARRDAV